MPSARLADSSCDAMLPAGPPGGASMAYSASVSTCGSAPRTTKCALGQQETKPAGGQPPKPSACELNSLPSVSAPCGLRLPRSIGLTLAACRTWAILPVRHAFERIVLRGRPGFMPAMGVSCTSIAGPAEIGMLPSPGRYERQGGKSQWGAVETAASLPTAETESPVALDHVRYGGGVPMAGRRR